MVKMSEAPLPKFEGITISKNKRASPVKKPTPPKSEWSVSPSEKASFEKIFKSFDKSGAGVIPDDKMQKILKQSKLD